MEANLMEEEKEKGIGYEQRAGLVCGRKDVVSKLPDSLISEILLYLPTKEAVSTSVLSHRWKRLWLLVPGLDLDSTQFPNYNAFVKFVDKFLYFYRGDNSCLHKLKLSILKFDITQPCFTRWIHFVAMPKLKNLDVECLPLVREVKPLSLYVCDSLVYLRLHRVLLGNFESVCLPCLKTMRLERNIYPNEAALESLISSCPILEDLSIFRRVDDNVKVLRVHSQTITSFSIKLSENDDDIVDLVGDLDFEDSSLNIDAPVLKFLNFRNDSSGSKIIRNSGSLAKVSIAGSFDLKDTVDEVDLRKRNMILNFFTAISRVKDMKITFCAFLMISNFRPLLQFCNLSCLEVELYPSIVGNLPWVLECCPNLKSLRLELRMFGLFKEVRLLLVPQCLLSSLEFVEIKGMFRRREPSYMDVAMYFAVNSVILKKLVLRLRGPIKEEDSARLRDSLALPMQSRTCQIEVC